IECIQQAALDLELTVNVGLAKTQLAGVQEDTPQDFGAREPEAEPGWPRARRLPRGGIRDAHREVLVGDPLEDEAERLLDPVAEGEPDWAMTDRHDRASINGKPLLVRVRRRMRGPRAAPRSREPLRARTSVSSRSRD